MRGQYGWPEYQGQEEPESSSHKGAYIVLGIVAVMFVAIFFSFFSSWGADTYDYGSDGAADNMSGSGEDVTEPPAAEDLCGNQVCDTGEGCFSCPRDCGCSGGMFCNIDSDKCERPLFDVESLIKEEYGDTTYKLLSQFESEGRKTMHVVIGGQPFMVSDDGTIEPVPNI